ncbi:histidine kinase/response regulator hybrid protein [Xanthomonas arboricola pv. fragariae]|uniref:hybrid sensor histidine kinase/response regulator n=1 Tax=Xanthomonas arboricola TaxID=56448 RepID=UPI000C857E26|nr:hybrid sensor histidine kinase/response regulator [Xanthomonas arboricola]SOT97531.1 histidine kinase/response regulator hybrid protein [Xanthomonas arboricola pv. fragariae]
MRYLLFVLLAALTVFPALAGVPAIPRFRIVGAAEGLPSTMITAIAQDRAGYLWMTTTDGLVRYDGAEFKVWRNDPTDRYSLRSNILQALYIDRQDRIWLALGGAGVAMLSADRRKLTAYLPDDVPELALGDVYAIAGRGDEVWFGLSNGNVLRLDAAGKFTSFDLAKMEEPLPASPVYALALDDRDRMWIGTLGGLAYYDGLALHRVRPDGDGSGITALQWVGQRLWASMDTGLRYMDASGAWHTPSWAPMFATGNRAWTVADAGDGEFWLGTEQGLWHTRPDHPPTPVNNGDAPLVSNRHVTTIWRSPHGGIWVPLHGRGLAYLREDWRRTAAFRQINDQGKGIACSLAPANRSGGLWQFDSSGRLLRYDTSTGALVQTGIQHPDLRDLQIATTLEDSRGQLWLGNGEHQLSRLDLGTGALEHFSGDGPAEAVIWLGESGDGTLWSAYEQVIQRRNPVTGRVLETISQADPHGLKEVIPSQLSVAPDGNLWLSAVGGMYVWQSESHRFVAVPGLQIDPIQRFVFEDQSHLWLYRAGSMERWQKDGAAWKRVRRILAAEGFPAMDAYGLERDELGRVWMSGPRGLWRIDARMPRAKIRSFSARDGLTSQEFSRRCLLMARDGVLVGGTADGYTLLIDTKAPDVPSFTPQMRLEAVSVQRADRRQALPILGGFSLAPNDRQLRINMRLLSFVDPMANRYRTRLSGFDTEWMEHGAAGMREFSSLPPGNYVLQMQGIDPLGNASQVQSLRFSVTPPWWRSDAGIALICMLAVLLAGLLAAAYRRRVRMRAQWQLAQHKRELAEQASLAKTRFLATLGHEVRTPMTGVLGMSELLLQTPLDGRQQGYASAIQLAGKHLLRLVNDALDLARIEAGKLPLDYRDFDLRQLISQVAELVRPSAEQKQLVFACELDDALPPALHGDASRVQQILLNLLFNAVKFTERGSVSLRVAVVPQSHKQGIRIEVCDTGPGMSAEQRGRLFQRFEQAEGAVTLARHGGSGLGLAICRELAAAMGGAVTVSSELGQGACFVVELPLRWVSALPAVPAPTRTSSPQAQAPLQLLLVEDDPTVAQVIIGLLQTRGHRVTHVLHGLAALAEVSTRSFDAGLCDLDLPGIDGAALVAQLRARGVRFPIVAVTARADADAEPQAMAAGCNGFLRKPVTGELLAQALAGVLADAADAHEAPAVD